MSFNRDIVRIDRTVQGIAMRVAVPVHAYRGVALMMTAARDGSPAYRLNLVHRDVDLSIALDEALDDSDIVADWRLWSRFFRLPALVERRPGSIEQADPCLGDVVLGTGPTLRRASRFPSKRRSRFLRRRKPARLPESAVLHADEREIIARH